MEYQPVAMELPFDDSASQEADPLPDDDDDDDDSEKATLTRLVACFWILGLLNNSSYVIIIACAKNISEGGTAIAAPDATWLVEPTPHDERLFVVDIDHTRVREERQNFDVAGHYGRPDVLQLHVNAERQASVRIR